MLRLRLGSGSTALYRSTVYGNGVVRAMSNYSPSTLFLLCCRSRSRIIIKLGLHQIDSLRLYVCFFHSAVLEPNKNETALYDQNIVSEKQNLSLFFKDPTKLVY
jgi:hypothetical protein